MRLFARTTIKLHPLVLSSIGFVLTIVVAGCGGGGPEGRGAPIPPVNAGPTASAAPTPTATSNFAEFIVPSAKSSLVGLTPGPDGNVWFTEGTSLKVGYVTPTGTVSEFNVASISPTAGVSVGNIASGQGQTLWFAYTGTQGSSTTSYLYQVSTSATMLTNANETSCIAPGQCYSVTVLEPGPSGNVIAGDVLYASSSSGGLNTILQELSAAGQLAAFDNTPSNGTQGILDDVVATTGQAWASWQLYGLGGPPSSPAITAIATSGTLTAYQLPGTYQPGNGAVPVAGQTSSDLPYSTSQDLTIGADGAPWIALNGGPGSALGRIASDGSIALHVVSSANVQIAGITTGSDGALWFTEAATNKIGRMTTSGTLTEYPVPTANAGLGRIVAGPNNTLWFTEVWANKIGRYTY